MISSLELRWSPSKSPFPYTSTVFPPECPGRAKWPGLKTEQWNNVLLLLLYSNCVHTGISVADPKQIEHHLVLWTLKSRYRTVFLKINFYVLIPKSKYQYTMLNLKKLSPEKLLKMKREKIFKKCCHTLKFLFVFV